MSLTHAPAHTTSYPDRFENEEIGWGYSVRQDTDAPDPRTDLENEHAALWAYREPRIGGSVAGDLPEGNIAIDAFARYWEEYDAAECLVLTQRYLAAFHPEKKITVSTATIRGYSQGDWLDVVCAVEEGYGTPESYIDEFRQWAFGDVWIVIPDGKAGISNIYADDAKEALKYFRENFEDAVIETDDDDTDDQTPLDPFAVDGGSLLVAWQIDSEEAVSPVQAALQAWSQNFRRGPYQPTNEDACVFDVTDPATGQNIEIDLSKPEFTHLFPTIEEN